MIDGPIVVVGICGQQAQLKIGNFAPTSVSVGDLFMGALLPGLTLVALYVLYIVGVGLFQPRALPAIPPSERDQILSAVFFRRLVAVLVPPLLLIFGVLGSILFGVATPTEAASVGAVGAMVLSLIKGQFSKDALREVMRATTEINAMVFTILIGASIFSLVFRGYGGDAAVGVALSALWRRRKRGAEQVHESTIRLMTRVAIESFRKSYVTAYDAPPAHVHKQPSD